MDILVVDDEKEICLMFVKWLSTDGHRVEWAMSGEKAMNLVEKQNFDVVFLDIIMPGIPAIDVLERINKISPDTEVIVITGHRINEELKKELEDKGVSKFFQKPFEMKYIVKAVEDKE